MTTTLPSEPLHSPTFTDTSVSSFDLVASSPRSRSSTISDLVAHSDSEEKIVWTVARRRRASAVVESSSSTEDDSEDDFVVLGRRRIPQNHDSRSSPGPSHNLHSHPTSPSTPTSLTTGLARMSLNVDRVSENNSDDIRSTTVGTSRPSVTVKASGQAEGSQGGSGRSSHTADLLKPPLPRRQKTRGSKRKSKRSPQSGLGERPIVDDFSESAIDDCASDVGSQVSIYEEAVHFVTLFLTNPGEYNTTSGRLMLLQSIIIELGLSTSVPSSVSSAKAILNSQAFVNVREYLAVREQGLEALQRIMHPSRSSLARSIKKSKKRVSLQWVKQHGLDVFLVPCFYH